MFSSHLQYAAYKTAVTKPPLCSIIAEKTLSSCGQTLLRREGHRLPLVSNPSLPNIPPILGSSRELETNADCCFSSPPPINNVDHNEERTKEHRSAAGNMPSQKNGFTALCRIGLKTILLLLLLLLLQRGTSYRGTSRGRVGRKMRSMVFLNGPKRRLSQDTDCASLCLDSPCHNLRFCAWTRHSTRCDLALGLAHPRGVGLKSENRLSLHGRAYQVKSLVKGRKMKPQKRAHKPLRLKNRNRHTTRIVYNLSLLVSPQRGMNHQPRARPSVKRHSHL